MKFNLFKFKKPNRLPIKMKLQIVGDLQKSPTTLKLIAGPLQLSKFAAVGFEPLDHRQRSLLLAKSSSKREKRLVHSLSQEFNLLNLQHLKDLKKLEILKSIRDKNLFLFALCKLVNVKVIKDSLPNLIKNLENATVDRIEKGLRRHLVEKIASSGDYTTGNL
jgi:hypothetical protein